MKNLINLTAILLISTISLFGNNNGPIETVLLSNDEINVVTFSEEALFTSFEFNSDNNNFEITTSNEITVIQIITSSGNVEFQLPVDSNVVSINKNLFDSGEYKLGFVLTGTDKMEIAEVSIK